MSVPIDVDVPDVERPVRTAVWGKIALLADPFGHGLCLIEFLNRGYDEIAEPRRARLDRPPGHAYKAALHWIKPPTGLLTMANSSSAKKRIRQTERRTAVNRARVSRIRTFVRKVELAIASGDAEAARAAFLSAQPVLMSGVNKGLVHRNTVARKLSRLSRRIKALA